MSLINNDKIIQGSFLKISNAFRQLPVLNVSHPKLLYQSVCFIFYILSTVGFCLMFIEKLQKDHSRIFFKMGFCMIFLRASE